MLSFFRTNQVFNTLLLLPYVILLRVAAIYLSPPVAAPIANGIAAEWLYQFIDPYGWVGQVVAMLLLLIQAFLLNLIILEHRLQRDSTLFPGIFLILFSSILPSFLYLSPILLGNLFLLIALLSTLRIWNTKSPTGYIFNTGFWLGVASLFYFSYTYLLLFGVLALSTLRAFSFKEIWQLLLGWLVPYWLVGGWYYWQGKLGYFITTQFTEGTGFWDVLYAHNVANYVALGVFLFAIGYVLFSYGAILFKKIMQAQKKIGLFYQLLFATLFTLLFQADVSLQHFAILSVPLGCLMGLSFALLPKNLAEIFHLLLFVGILAYQWLPSWLA